MENVLEKVAATAAVESVVPTVAESVVEVATPITESVTETVAKKGWWSNSSSTTKALVIGAGLALAALGIWYFGFRKKEDEIIEEQESDVEKTDEELLAERTEKVVSQIENAHKVDPSTLPNNGIGCSEPRTAFNADNDFVKCEGKWFIKTKQKPSNKAELGRFPEWTPLEDGQIVIEQLNSRYPND